LAIDLEGTEVCDWLTSKGITCVLLKYRVPGEGKLPKSGAYPASLEALEDAQRTLGLVRYHAAEWHIDPSKIGVLGFSAGGHMVAAISNHFEHRLYPAVDAADHCHAYLSPDAAYVLATERGRPRRRCRAIAVYYLGLKKAGVPVEMHLYAQGGHAFGLRHTTLPVTAWPQLVETWLETIGMIPK
jgi:acetyl esterase/lipase